MRERVAVLIALLALATGACGSHTETHDVTPEVATPPFAVRGDLSGLLIVWYDGDGTHSARTLADVPAAHRDAVRVESLRAGPGDESDGDAVWVADARQPGTGGGYVVRRMSRDAFDARVAAAQLAAHPPEPRQQIAQNDAPPADDAPAGGGSGDIVIYGASWCGACRAAQQYLTSRHVAFVDKDIERDPGAADEMRAKLARAHLQTSGIPVIDFRGHILLGFDRGRIDSLLLEDILAPDDATGTPI